MSSKEARPPLLLPAPTLQAIASRSVLTRGLASPAQKSSICCPISGRLFGYSNLENGYAPTIGPMAENPGASLPCCPRHLCCGLTSAFWHPCASGFKIASLVIPFHSGAERSLICTRRRRARRARRRWLLLDGPGPPSRWRRRRGEPSARPIGPTCRTQSIMDVRSRRFWPTLSMWRSPPRPLAAHPRKSLGIGAREYETVHSAASCWTDATAMASLSRSCTPDSHGTITPQLLGHSQQRDPVRRCSQQRGPGRRLTPMHHWVLLLSSLPLPRLQTGSPSLLLRCFSACGCESPRGWLGPQRPVGQHRGFADTIGTSSSASCCS